MKKLHLFALSSALLFLSCSSTFNVNGRLADTLHSGTQKVGACLSGAGSAVYNRLTKPSAKRAVALFDAYEQSEVARVDELMSRFKASGGNNVELKKELAIAMADLGKLNENLGKAIKTQKDIDELRKGLLAKIYDKLSSPTYKVIKGAVDSVITVLSPWASVVFMVAVLYHMNVLYVIENNEVFPFPMNIPMKAIAISLRIIAEMGIVPVEHLVLEYAKAQVVCLLALGPVLGHGAAEYARARSAWLISMLPFIAKRAIEEPVCLLEY